MAFATEHRITQPPITIEWISADRRLPAGPNLPVEVVFRDGTAEKRSSLTGDWREVIAWRTIDKEPGARKKKA
jgi:hypothetical protein